MQYFSINTSSILISYASNPILGEIMLDIFNLKSTKTQTAFCACVTKRFFKMCQAVDYIFETLVSVSTAGIELCDQQIIETSLL